MNRPIRPARGFIGRLLIVTGLAAGLGLVPVASGTVAADPETPPAATSAPARPPGETDGGISRTAPPAPTVTPTASPTPAPRQPDATIALPTYTPSPTFTATPTSTPTIPPTPTFTASPTWTPSPTFTPPPTYTPHPSQTPVPSATPTARPPDTPTAAPAHVPTGATPAAGQTPIAGLPPVPPQPNGPPISELGPAPVNSAPAPVTQPIAQPIAYSVPASTGSWSAPSEPALTLSQIQGLAGALPAWAYGPSLQLSVPWRTQLDGSPFSRANCGPASLAMIMEGFGLNAQNHYLRLLANGYQGVAPNDYDAGLGPEALIAIAEDFGLRAYNLHGSNSRYRRWSFDDLRAELAAGRPVITLTHYRSLPGNSYSSTTVDHWIVLTGVLGQGFIYNDPAYYDASGRSRVLSPDQLRYAWDTSSVPGLALGLGPGGTPRRTLPVETAQVAAPPAAVPAPLQAAGSPQLFVPAPGQPAAPVGLNRFAQAIDTPPPAGVALPAPPPTPFAGPVQPVAGRPGEVIVAVPNAAATAPAALRPGEIAVPAPVSASSPATATATPAAVAWVPASQPTTVAETASIATKATQSGWGRRGAAETSFVAQPTVKAGTGGEGSLLDRLLTSLRGLTTGLGSIFSRD